MARNTFAIDGNICADRVRLARAMQKPPITQEELAHRINEIGLNDMSPGMIQRIENNERHVCDAELKALAQALNVTMDLLLEEGNLKNVKRKPK